MTTPIQPNRVQRRQEQTRARLIAAAAKLIATHGVEGLRLRDVTDAADVGFGSFYHHFPSKEDLVDAIVTDMIASLATATIARSAQLTDPAEAASAAHRWFVRKAYDEPELAWLIVHLDRADALFRGAVVPYARDLLQTGIDSGRFRPMDIDATLTYVVGGTFAVMRGVLEHHLGPEADITSAETLLIALGLDQTQAREVSRRELPGHDTSATPKDTRR
jgi:AcrR family transcriptional regulator